MLSGASSSKIAVLCAEHPRRARALETSMANSGPSRIILVHQGLLAKASVVNTDFEVSSHRLYIVLVVLPIHSGATTKLTIDFRKAISPSDFGSRLMMGPPSE